MYDTGSSRPMYYVGMTLNTITQYMYLSSLEMGLNAISYVYVNGTQYLIGMV